MVQKVKLTTNSLQPTVDRLTISQQINQFEFILKFVCPFLSTLWYFITQFVFAHLSNCYTI